MAIREIKINRNMEKLNKFNYFFNGVILMAIVSKPGKNYGQCVGNVPKKYWIDILLEPSSTTYAKVNNTYPITISKSSIENVNRFIKITNSFW